MALILSFRGYTWPSKFPTSWSRLLRLPGQLARVRLRWRSCSLTWGQGWSRHGWDADASLVKIHTGRFARKTPGFPYSGPLGSRFVHGHSNLKTTTSHQGKWTHALLRHPLNWRTQLMTSRRRTPHYINSRDCNQPATELGVLYSNLIQVPWQDFRFKTKCLIACLPGFLSRECTGS